MKKISTSVATGLCGLLTAAPALGYGTVSGKVLLKQENFNCAAFVYPMKKPPTSPFAAPLFAAPCSSNGSFSLTIPAGEYVVGTGITVGARLFASQPDPAQRIPLEGQGMQRVTINNDRSAEINLRPAPGPGSAAEAVSGPPNSAAASRLTITGTVRDQKGLPVSLAVVRLLDLSKEIPLDRRDGYLSTPTDVEGKYRIEGVEPAKYWLKAYKANSETIINSDAVLIDLSSPERYYDMTIPAAKPTAPAPSSDHSGSKEAKGLSNPKPVPVTVTDPASL